MLGVGASSKLGRLRLPSHGVLRIDVCSTHDRLSPCFNASQFRALYLPKGCVSIFDRFVLRFIRVIWHEHS